MNVFEELLVRSRKEQIRILKHRLSDSDYKIIKCTEYSLAGKKAPYDIAQLHKERQSVRDKINELEEKISD